MKVILLTASVFALCTTSFATENVAKYGLVTVFIVVASQNTHSKPIDLLFHPSDNLDLDDLNSNAPLITELPFDLSLYKTVDVDDLSINYNDIGTDLPLYLNMMYSIVTDNIDDEMKTNGFTSSDININSSEIENLGEIIKLPDNNKNLTKLFKNIDLSEFLEDTIMMP